MPPDRVLYRLEPTGVGQQVRERLLTERCPNCGTDWRPRGAATPRHEGRRTFRCTMCGEHFSATRVDAGGRPVAQQGWGLARQDRERQDGT